MILHLKCNLLYDIMLIPNLGADIYVSKNWSVSANWMYAWWNSNKRHNYWRIYGGELDIRKYFGRRAQTKPLTGHHLGIYGQAFTYDFETGHKGYIGGKPGGTLWDKLNYAIGVEYGYSLPISRRLNLDFTPGVESTTNIFPPTATTYGNRPSNVIGSGPRRRRCR